jgi:AcrR family transcriptional regulator
MNLALGSGRCQRKGEHKLVRKTKAERKREIVDATVQLLGTYGVQGTTVSRIAAAAGIARGALYQHFPNREALLEAAIAAMGERSSRWILEPTGTDVVERLVNIGRTHSTWSASEYNTFVRPFFQLLTAEKETALSRRILDKHEEDLGNIVALVEQGKQEGTIAPDVDSSDVAWCLLMHAWAEDIARLMGIDHFVEGGASDRILQRLLATYAARPGA